MAQVKEIGFQEKKTNYEQLLSFYAFTDSLDSIFFIIDAEGMIKFANHKSLDFFHLPHKLDKVSINSFLSLSSQKALQLALNQTKIEGNAESKTLNFRSENVDLGTGFIKLEQCQLYLNLFLCSLKVVNQYNESNSDLSSLLSNVSANLQEGVFRVDLRKGVVLVNDYCLTLFSVRRREDVIHKSLDLFFVDSVRSKRVFGKLLRNRILKNEIVYLRKLNGSTFWAMLNCRLAMDESGKLYTDGTIHDISLQKETEKLLREKNAELKKINSQLDKFIYSASHDIRSPMTSIMGLVNILRMEIDPSHYMFLDKIDASLHKLDYFIKETLQFSQNTKKRILSHKIDFEEIVQLSWDQVNGPKSDVALYLDVNDQEHIFYSDAERIITILKNLFRNSLQFSDNNKSEKYLKVKIEVGMRQVTMHIVDNGIGIQKAYLPQVFEMFFRAHDQLAGPGMGLYIVKETLLKLNGDIQLSSETSIGTSISILIPNDSKGLLIARKRSLKA